MNVKHLLDDNKAIPIYSGGSGKTIYGDKNTNYDFRAFHDMIHITYNLTFKKNDEFLVGAIQAVKLMQSGASVNDSMLVFADVIGQVKYYFKYNKFVDNQIGFISAYIKDQKNALSKEW